MTPPVLPERSASSSKPSADKRLAALRKAVDAEFRARKPSRIESPKPQLSTIEQRVRFKRRMLLLLVYAALAVLPFVALVRGSVWLYRSVGLGSWTALAGAGLLTLMVLSTYGALLAKKLTGALRFRFIATRIVLPVVVVYCGYTLLYLAHANAKTPEVSQYYRSLHPLLRVAIGTAIILDRDMVVTDTRREPSDYARMGLPLYENSLHFPQNTGFVHAVDLRTVGRSTVRNRLIGWYFAAAGFRTLRHVGTADHWHISLPLRR